MSKLSSNTSSLQSILNTVNNLPNAGGSAELPTLSNPGSAEDDTISAGEWIINVAERFYEGADPIGKTHIREGVVVRILNRPKFTAYKHKNFHFKVLEGIAKDEATEPDIEEASGLYDEDESGAES